MAKTPSHSGKSQYSAKNIEKPINFYCSVAGAKAVSLVGDFNEWDASAHPMTRQPDGSWFLEVPLSHGHHHYLFCVDGELILDQRAQGVARNAKNERVSLIAVS